MKLFNKEIKTCYFIGIGGKGMSCLAQYLSAQDIEVCGYDNKNSKFTTILESNGIKVFFDINPQRIAEISPDLVIYTPAIHKETNAELAYVFNNSILTMKRADVLGEITKKYKTISVSGTHGKTSTSATLAHILDNPITSTTSLIGGIMKNYNSGFINGTGDYLLIEADEYDKSFVKFQSFGLLITSIEADHLDTYGNFDNLLATFIYLLSTIPQNGFIAYCYDRKELRNFVHNLYCKNIITYSISDDTSDYYARNIEVVDNKYEFDIYYKNNLLIKGATLTQLGLHNIENSLGAVSIAHYLGVPVEIIANSLENHKGVDLRWDVGYRDDKITYISDYAHHPTEVSTTIKSLRSLNKEKKIFVLFHPHLYSRTKDNYEEFANSLDLADSVALLPIYPAREEPIYGVSSKLIFDSLKIKDKQMIELEDIIPLISNRASEFDIILTLGAGNISDYFGDIIKVLEDKFDSKK